MKQTKKERKMAKKNLGELFRARMGIVSTDAERAKALKKALKKLRAVEDLLCDAMKDTPQRVDMLFELNRMAVDVEEQFNYYAHGEVDNIR
jgi:hypothetical protein